MTCSGKTPLRDIVTSFDINDEPIAGFLGNQLFRYATVIGHAIDSDKLPMIPEWRYTEFFKKTPDRINSEYRKLILRYDEPSFEYNTIPKNVSVDLCGYFQSYEYFDPYKELVLSYIDLKDEYWDKIFASDKNSLKIPFSEILKKKTCSIHRRSGDYLALQGVFTNLFNTDYYHQCYEKMKDEVDYFLVFSNDIEESKRYFNWSDKFVFVEFDLERSQGNDAAILEMFLMSKCDHICIANSTFSWWAAYLSNHENIYYPSKWFGPQLNHNIKDLFPPAWKKVEINEHSYC